jgi:hypothetical protein
MELLCTWVALGIGGRPGTDTVVAPGVDTAEPLTAALPPPATLLTTGLAVGTVWTVDGTARGTLGGRLVVRATGGRVTGAVAGTARVGVGLAAGAGTTFAGAVLTGGAVLVVLGFAGVGAT